VLRTRLQVVLEIYEVFSLVDDAARLIKNAMGSHWGVVKQSVSFITLRAKFRPPYG
jgi:hypothetical protein